MKERVAEIIDKCNNYLAATRLPVSPAIHVEGLIAGVREIRSELEELVRSVPGTSQGEAPTCDLCGEADESGAGGYVCRNCAVTCPGIVGQIDSLLSRAIDSLALQHGPTCASRNPHHDYECDCGFSDIEAWMEEAPVSAPAGVKEGEDDSALVDVVCGYCEWQGKMLALDLIDHPCPKCGKYGGPAAVRGPASNPVEK